MTKSDENVMSHHFVNIPHANPGPGSGKIPAWNDPDLRASSAEYKDLILNLLFYWSECWALPSHMLKRLRSFH